MVRHLGGVNRLLLPIVGIFCLSACVHNTLAQDLAWERWQQCSGHRAVTLKEVRPNGQISVHVRADDRAEYAAWQECMRKAAAQQASKRKEAQGVPEPVTSLTPANVPEWRRGYEWAFRWESPRGQGMFVWSVDRIETVEGTDFYVLKGRDYETYWRRGDLAFHMEKRLRRDVEVRHSPPQAAYAWPLTVGVSWEQTYTTERRAERAVNTRTMRCAVDEQERVPVPAGVFDTFRIECRDKRTRRVMFRRWYSPAVSHWVREETFFDYGMRERELIAFRIPQDTRTRVVSLIPETSLALVQDDAEAARSSRKAAEAGEARAMAKLGFMYFAGQGGLEKDDAEAVRWFRKGADGGDGLAMAFLGVSYWTGLGGLSRDAVEAVHWFRKGASAGDGRAMAMLGQAYLTGAVGLVPDETQAVRWFQKGVEAGDARAMVMLGEMYLSGGGGLAKDDAAALRWFRRAAEARDGFAMARLGNFYETGEAGLAKNDAEALRWYRQGAAAGSGRAMAGLGGMYAAGRGGPAQNDGEAVRWYRQGAGLLDAIAMFQLGQAYEAGRGVARDRKEAARWYGKAASFGVPDAFDRLVALEEQP